MIRRVAVLDRNGIFNLMAVNKTPDIPLKLQAPNGSILHYWKTSAGGFHYYKEEGVE